MNKILILGAGMSSSTLIRYLLDHSCEYDWKITVGDKDAELANSKINGHENAIAVEFDIFDEGSRRKLIGEHDVVVSMLPARMHPLVANDCVILKKHMVTASYVSKEVKELDQKARESGIVMLNELGVDPGIDHMSAMKLVDDIRNKGGKILLFKSSTGGLIAPEYDTNPWNYKFTWNPRNVVLAGQGTSMFIRNGRYKYIPYHKLFGRVEKTTVLDYGEFEVYPNRDSLKYREIYGLQDIPTIFRGTLRRPGFCKAWDIFVQLGMTDDNYQMQDVESMTWRQFINSFLRYEPKTNVEDKLCDYLGLDPDGEVMQKLKWLGIFDDKPVGLNTGSPAQILQKLLEDKWMLEPGDKDMIAMQHKIEYEIDGKRRLITSSMATIGQDAPHTAMSVTVGTPVAIAVKLLLAGKINLKGVHIPIKPELYSPILKELEDAGIRFVDEETEVE
ncbi:MAG: saccharopine dehydrogenase NADP-binding domain-containing protein [Bacteroidales bacterium]|nr:saccharopine dehydrogenase NADP-binding domain-containing protein [Bacteroidales bacterium]